MTPSNSFPNVQPRGYPLRASLQRFAPPDLQIIEAQLSRHEAENRWNLSSHINLLWGALCVKIMEQEIIATGFPDGKSNERPVAIDPLFVIDASPNFRESSLAAGGLIYTKVRLWVAPGPRGVHSTLDAESAAPLPIENSDQGPNGTKNAGGRPLAEEWFEAFGRLAALISVQYPHADTKQAKSDLSKALLNYLPKDKKGFGTTQRKQVLARFLKGLNDELKQLGAE